MECKKCGSKWEAARSISQIKNCPFCGASLVDGRGCVANIDLALHYMQLSANQGNQQAIDELNTFNREMNRANNNTSGCFVTTAVCDSFGKSDDCYELTAFRAFRDNWLVKEGNWFSADDISSACDVVVSERKQTVEPEFNELFEFLKQKYNLELVRCPAGTFMMGSPSRELGRSPNEIQHQVTISKDFNIAKYPVTQAQYKAIMGNNPSYFKGENNPVECVSWVNAKEFCDKLNKLTKSTRPAVYRFDLPTEAQWEYACRAGTTTSLNSGKNITESIGYCSNVDEVGWYYGNSGRTTHPVGLKKPNAWGIYDMHGNVCEWCRDRCDEYPSGSCTDPEGPDSGSYRVYRGSGWRSFPWYCRSANRCNYAPDFEDCDLGFRIALVLSSK